MRPSLAQRQPGGENRAATEIPPHAGNAGVSGRLRSSVMNAQPSASSPAPASLPEMSLPEWLVLAILAEHPAHGFAVAQLTAAGGDLGRVWQIPKAVVYR